MKKYFLILFCFVLGLTLTGCFEKGPKLTDENSVIVYFLKSKRNGFKYYDLRREIKTPESRLKQAIRYLLSGVTKKESRKKIGSEIPVGTRLLSYDEGENYVKIDLSSQFVSGGGSLSMKARINQLIKTTEANEPTKSVILLIDGKEIHNIGGEGYVFNNPIYKPGAESDPDKQGSDITS